MFRLSSATDDLGLLVECLSLWDGSNADRSVGARCKSVERGFLFTAMSTIAQAREFGMILLISATVLDYLIL